MRVFNTNTLHNVINVAMVLVPALEQFDWTPFFDDSTALKIVGALGLAKILINLLRDGPGGMIKQQPPVR